MAKKTSKSIWIFLCLILAAVLIYLFARPQVPAASESLREVIGQQKAELRKLIDSKKYVPAYFFDYDVTSYKKLDTGKFEIGITGTADYGTAVNHSEQYRFTLDASSKEEGKKLDQILNFARISLKKLTEREGELFYFNDNLTGEYEFGMQQDGLKYYFLLANRSFNTGGDDWSFLGWSEGMLPEDWNDWIALQKQDTVPKRSFSVQEYEEFLPAYIENLNKLADESYQIVHSMLNNQDRVFGGKHYKLLAKNQKMLLNEAKKAMNIAPPSEYGEAHRMLVQAMYELQKNAAAYVEGEEGYLNEKQYNFRGYEPDITNAIETADKAYGCFAAQSQSESFEEYKYHELEQTTRAGVSSAEKEYYKIHPTNAIRSDCGMLKISQSQYAVYVDETDSSQIKTYRLLIEHKNGVWQVTNKEEVRF